MRRLLRSTRFFKGLLLLIAVATLVISASGENPVRDVSGEATVKFLPGESYDAAKLRAIRAAKTDALRKAFGEDVEVNNMVQIASGTSNVTSVGHFETRGEWISTKGEPEVNLKTTLSGEPESLVVSIKGKARKRPADQVQFNAEILRNGSESRNADSRFVSGDDLRVLFKSLSDGWLCIYLIDNDNAVCLLPYPGESAGAQRILSGKEYVFFDEGRNDAGTDPNLLREYEMTCDGQTEVNTICFIYSRNRFDKPSASLSPNELSFVSSAEFYDWLGKRKIQDTELKADEQLISIFASKAMMPDNFDLSH